MNKENIPTKIIFIGKVSELNITRNNIKKLPPTVINVSKGVSKALLILAVNDVRTSIPPRIIKVLDNNKFDSIIII
jgi:hypothetical protein